MKIPILILALAILLTTTSCRQIIEREYIDHDYFDIATADTIATARLIAVTDEEFLQYGARVAYVDNLGDTIITRA